MKVLLTGANGFIGRNLMEHTDKSVIEYIPVDRKVTPLDDFTSIVDFAEKKGAKTIVHCATKPGHRMAVDRNGLTFENVKMYENLSKATDILDGKLYVIGSGCEYDQKRELNMVCEEEFGKVIPKDEVSFHKYLIGKLIEKDKNSVNLRCFGVFGKYEEYSMRFISSAIIKSLLGKEIIINEDKSFSYLYIDDLVKIVNEFVVKGCERKSYNITPNETVTMSQIASLISQLAGGIKVTVKSKGYDYTGDNSRLNKEFKPTFTPINQAVCELMEYYKKVLDKLDLSGFTE